MPPEGADKGKGKGADDNGGKGKGKGKGEEQGEEHMQAVLHEYLVMRDGLRQILAELDMQDEHMSMRDGLLQILAELELRIVQLRIHLLGLDDN